MPIEFRGNAGTPLQLLFLYGGVQVECECASATRGARLRSVAENGLGMANFDRHVTDNTPENHDTAEPKVLYQTSDSDFDNNDRLDLSGQVMAPEQDGFFKGYFAFSGAAGTVVTGVYLTSIAFATAQGDCVFVANLNRD